MTSVLTAVFKAQDKLSSALVNAGNQGTKTTSILQKLGSLGSKAVKGIVTAVGAASAALVGLGKKALDVGINYETSMSQVMATMGLDKSTEAGEKAYETLAAAAEQMGATTAFSTTQAADALNYLALAGYDADKAVAALPTVLHLAGAGGMELSAASDMITDSMAALQMEVNQTNLDKFADQMAKTASTTNTSVSALGEAILTVGATAANLRNGTTELNTQLGILANVGIKGAEGGTHLRNILLRLQSPTDKAAKQLNKLGVTVYDVDGKMRGTGAIFEDLKNSMAGMDQNEIDQIMSTIFNKTDIAAANALLAASGDEYERIFGIIENSGGAAAEMYSTMLDNLKGDVDIFNSTVEALYIEVFKSTNGLLRDLVQTGTGYMQRLIDAFKVGGFSGLTTELGNVLGDAAGVIVSYAPMLIQAGTEIVTAFVGSIGNNAETLFDAGAKIALQLGTAVIRIAPKLGKTFVNMLRAATKALIGSIPDIFKAVPDSIFNALGMDKNEIVKRVSRFASLTKTAIESLFRGNFTGAFNVFGAAFNIHPETLEKIRGALTGVGRVLNNIWSFAQKAGTAIAGFIGKFAKIGGTEAVVAGLAAAFAALKAVNIGKTLMNAAKGISNIAKGIQSAGGIMKILAANKLLVIAAAIGAVVAAIVLLVKNWDSVKASLSGGLDKVFGAGTFDKISASLEKVGEKFGKLGTWATDSYNKMKSAFSQGYQDAGLVGGIKAALGSIGESLGDVDWAGIGSSIWNTVKNNFGEAGDWIKEKILGKEYTPDSSWGDVGSKIWTAIKNGVGEQGDRLKAWILGNEYKPESTWADAGKKIWETIKSGISAQGDKLKAWILGDNYNPETSTWADAGTAIWEAIKGKTSAAGDKLKEWILGDNYKPGESTWKNAGEAIWNAIKSGIGAAGDKIKEWILGDSYTPDASWGQVAVNIWNAIKAGIDRAGDKIKELVLGDSYTPDSSWGDIGSKIWETIKGGINATGDWLKEKLSYIPSDSWKTVGIDLWNKIKEGISDSGDWLKSKLGYSPSDSWGSIGSSIWEKIKNGISDTGDWLKTKLAYTPSDSWNSIGGSLWEKIKNGISATGDWLKTKLDYTPDDSWKTIGADIWSKIKNGITATGDWIKELILGESYTPDSSWSDAGEAIWNAIKGGVNVTTDNVKEWFSGVDWGGVWDKIKDSGETLWEKMKTAVTSAIESAKTYFSTIDWGAIWDKISDTKDALEAKIQELLGKLPGIIQDLASDAANFLNSGSFASLGESIVGFLSKGIESKTGGGAARIIEAITKLFDGLNFEELTGNISEAVSGLGDFLVKAISAAISAAGNGATALIDAIGNLFSSLFSEENRDAVFSGLKSLGESFVKVLCAGFDAVGDAATGITSAISTLLSNALSEENLASALDGLTNLGGSIIELLVSAIKKAMDTAGRIYDAIAELLSGINFEEVGVSLGTFATGLINKLGSEMEKVEIADLANSLGTLIGKAINGIKSAALGIVQALTNWILSGEVFTALWNITKSLVSMAWNFFKSLFSEIWDSTWIGGALDNMLNGYEVEVNPYLKYGEIKTDFEGLNDDLNYQAKAIIDGLDDMISAYIKGEEITIDEIYASVSKDALKETPYLDDDVIAAFEQAGVFDEIERILNAQFGQTPIETNVSVNPKADITSSAFDADKLAAQAQSAVNAAMKNVSVETPDLTTDGISIVSTLSTGITDSDAIVDTAMSKITGTITTIVADVDLTTNGVEIVNTLSTGITDNYTSVDTAMTGLTDAITTKVADVDLTTNGADIVNTLSTGITDSNAIVDTAITEITDTITTKVADVDLKTNGVDIVNTLSAGIIENNTAIDTAITGVTDTITTKAAAVDLYGTGQNIMRGLQNGLNSMRSDLIRTANSIANTLKSTIQKGLDVHSPSRFTDWIGRMMGQGLINSLGGMEKKVATSAAAVALAASSAFSPLAAAEPAYLSAPAFTMEYESAIMPKPLSISADGYYHDKESKDAAGGGGNGERHIVIDLNGGGRIDVGGLTKDQAVELISERIRPEMMRVLSDEIFEGGDNTYEF